MTSERLLKRALSGVHHGSAQGFLARLLATLDALIQGAGNDARVGLLGVSKLPALVDLLVCEADLPNRGNLAACEFGMLVAAIAAVSVNLAPLLRCVVLVGELGFRKVEDVHFAGRAGRARMNSRLAVSASRRRSRSCWLLGLSGAMTPAPLRPMHDDVYPP